MQLGGLRNRVAYCAEGRQVLTWQPDRGITAHSTIPNPCSGRDRLRFDLLNTRLTKRLIGRITGDYTTTNVWTVGDSHLLATVGRRVFSSPDDGQSWSLAHELPASSGPMGVLPTSFCEHGDKSYLAEYPLGDEVARVLVSNDLGRSWSTHHARDDVRHFHGLFHDPYGERLWATTGDTDHESAVGYFVDGEFRPVGRGSQRWRAVQLAFTPEAVVWGMDCPYVDRVELLALPRDQLGAEEPKLVTLGTTRESVYYVETLSIRGETVIVAATTAGSGSDSTAPNAERGHSVSETARVLVTTSQSTYRSWHELCSFTRRSAAGDSVSVVPSANAYIFIRTDPDLGLLINPYNMQRHHGEIFRVPLSEFDRMLSDPDSDPLPMVDGIASN